MLTTILIAASMAVGHADQVSPHYEHLNGLEKFAGEWQVAMSQNGVEIFKGTAANKWMKNKSFLLTTYFDEEGDCIGTEVFGWDAATKTIRLWGFKLDGGRNEAVISIEGDVFTGDYDMIQPDGTTRKASVKGKFSDRQFNAVVRYPGTSDEELKATYRRK